ncbi:MAG: serine hydrolase domain-containing protein [Armatimonadota bacterium]|nr:beta-lactamase family protein [bacterium]
MNFTSVDPISAGISPAGLAMAEEVINEGIGRELYPGAAAWVGRRGVTAFVHYIGYTDFSRKHAIGTNTLWDLASLTKPVATAPSVLLLCQDGHIHLGQSIAEFFPNRDLDHLSGITLRHLLTHTSGLPPYADIYSDSQTRDDTIDKLFALKPVADPGAAYVYSCLGYIMLALVVEAVAGVGLDEFARTRLFEPLGLRSTSFNPSCQGERDAAFAATDNSLRRMRPLYGEVHDEIAWAMGGVSGNAGLFSTVQDLALFCHSVTFKNNLSIIPPLGSAVMQQIFSNALPESVGGQTLGWFIYPNEMMPGGDFVSKSAIGHSGFTGTAVVIDPKYELYMVFLTNRVCRNDDGKAFRNLRRRVFNAILGAIV